MVPYFVGVPAIMYTNPSNFMAWLSKTFVMVVWRQEPGESSLEASSIRVICCRTCQQRSGVVGWVRVRDEGD